MTNDELMTNDKVISDRSTGHWEFRIPSAFVIRPSSLRRVVLLLVVALAFTACHKRLSKANVDEVTQGMSRKQVESILGPPTSIDSTNLLITKKITYVYQQGNESVTVVFFNDEVSSKESNLRE